MNAIPKVPAWQLVIRFALEVVSVWAIGSAARASVEGAVQGWVLAISAAITAIALWVTFNVVGDPSRSGRAPVPVSGVVRLVLELVVFGSGAAGLALTGRWPLLAAFVVALVVHHAGTIPRLRWLVEQRRGGT